ncbi:MULTISPECIES: HNH endonuclease signature motif containing protein [Streptomyces]|uniref:HNH endonuclease signature motif containing protein n=1 Tax=Streptomyces TaxID=1883 RepID=UPI0022495508|nr:HNH endonuclease [Streptomyces sp. JHD 1]MCX2971471.1 HNH endonuclease [Streptomyces sp. JHD 1]
MPMPDTGGAPGGPRAVGARPGERRGTAAAAGGYVREKLAAAVARSTTWSGVLRALGFRPSGGRRRTVQRRVAEYGISTAHFAGRSHWHAHSDAALADAVRASTSLREVAVRLGVRPASGSLSHLGRRVRAAGLDVTHFPGFARREQTLDPPVEELRRAAAHASDVRALARLLGVPEDAGGRAELRRLLRRHAVDTSHFRHARVPLPEEELRRAVSRSTSIAEVVRALGLPDSSANWHRVRRRVTRLGLDTSHFRRRLRPAVRPPLADPGTGRVFRVLPPGSPRTEHARLRRALDAAGVPYACVSCGNTGQWLGRPMTLQIDHRNGDWRDNRRDNLRYLCPNCHAVTDTWCGRGRGRRTARAARPVTPPGHGPVS